MREGVCVRVCVWVCVRVCVRERERGVVSWTVFSLGFTSRVSTAQFYFMLMGSILHVFVYNLTLSCPYRYIYSVVIRIM